MKMMYSKSYVNVSLSGTVVFKLRSCLQAQNRIALNSLKNIVKIIKRSEQKMYDVENYEFEIFEIFDTDFNLAS